MAAQKSIKIPTYNPTDVPHWQVTDAFISQKIKKNTDFINNTNIKNEIQKNELRRENIILKNMLKISERERIDNFYKQNPLLLLNYYAKRFISCDMDESCKMKAMINLGAKFKLTGSNLTDFAEEIINDHFTFHFTNHQELVDHITRILFEHVEMESKTGGKHNKTHKRNSKHSKKSHKKHNKSHKKHNKSHKKHSKHNKHKSRKH